MNYPHAAAGAASAILLGAPAVAAYAIVAGVDAADTGAEQTIWNAFEYGLGYWGANFLINWVVQQ